jgi:hypothetical protein
MPTGEKEARHRPVSRLDLGFDLQRLTVLDGAVVEINSMILMLLPVLTVGIKVFFIEHQHGILWILADSLSLATDNDDPDKHERE